ncbi:MAG: rod shape-determining protein MreD [Gammaproteobacteria bacterium]|nr:rod shape-determining protein MreD [Gammaproteobacteria bacterium]MDH3559825.1 rod shape-determining protein MreD [Gammaproteobacteria bacterium]
MILGRRHGGGIIAVTFVIALLLTIAPLPDSVRYLRPDWVGLVLIYWCLAVPDRVGVGTGWGMGLLVDLLTGSLLGQHAMALAVVAFLTLKLHLRVRLFPVWQQALTVLVLLILHQLLSLWVSRFIGRPGPPFSYWAPSLLGMFIWPFIYIALRSLRRGFRIS